MASDVKGQPRTANKHSQKSFFDLLRLTGLLRSGTLWEVAVPNEVEDGLAEQNVDEINLVILEVDDVVVIPMLAKYSCDVDQEEEDGSCKRGVREAVKPKSGVRDGVEVRRSSKSTSGKTP